VCSSRVELTNASLPFQASDRLVPSRVQVPHSSAGSSISPAGGSSGNNSSNTPQGERMGRRRSSASLSEHAAAARGLLASFLHHTHDDRSFIALDMDPEHACQQRWRSTVPEDVLVHSFSFLTPAELATVSTVSRSWSHASYEPSLWTHMDLSGLYLRVDDAFIIHLLGSRRFVHLKFLSLEGCSAITSKSIRAIMHFCPNLREIRLTDCRNISNPWLFVEMVKALPFLRRLELFGATREFGIVQAMQAARPKLDLGLFWLEYCAENGIKLNGSGLADCRYQDAFEGGGDDDQAAGRPGAPARVGGAAGAGQRGCWGRVKGRIIYASNFYHRGGNYPRTVLYSCENHSQQDFTDDSYHRCQVCEHLFAAPYKQSMRTEMICKVCFDRENLHNKKNWISLTDSTHIKQFGLTELVNKTVHVASRKNLPESLRSFGTTPCRLDYNLPEPLEIELEESPSPVNEESLGIIPRIGFVGLHAGSGLLDRDNVQEERKIPSPSGRNRPQRIDPGEVPLDTFVSVNGWRIDETVHRIRTQLRQASEQLNTRALLVYDSSHNIEVLADKRVILDGREGEEHMDLTVQAWAVALEIIYPVVIVMILSLHFSVLFYKQAVTTYTGETNYMSYIAPPSDGGMGALLVIIIALCVIVGIIIGAVLVYRFREQCERVRQHSNSMDSYY
jgi:hypothetical protein